MTDVNRGDVVEIIDVRLSPTCRQLRRRYRRLAIAQKRGVVAAFFLLLFLRLWL